MYSNLIKISVLLAAMSATESKTVIVGDVRPMVGSNVLIYQNEVNLDGFPFLKRETDVYYQYPNPGLLIKGISVRDLNDSQGEAAITRGGIGFNFVNINLVTERGSGLKYLIQIYG